MSKQKTKNQKKVNRDETINNDFRHTVNVIRKLSFPDCSEEERFFVNVIIMMSMHSTDWLPHDHETFHFFQSRLRTACGTNAVAWSLDATELLNLNAEGVIWDTIAPIGMDKQNRTDGQQKAMMAVWKTYRPHFRDYVMHNLKNNAAVTVLQRTGLGIPLMGTPHHTHPTVQIATPMFLQIMSGGTASILCNGHVDHSALGRGHIPHGENIFIDSMEVAYLIMPKGADPGTPPDADNIGNPNDPNSKGHRATFHKGRFHLNLGTANSGCWVIIYARWTHTSYPQFAGNWSGVQMMRIP